MPVNKKISFSIWYVFLAIFAVVLVHDFIVAMQKVEELPYSEFRTLLCWPASRGSHGHPSKSEREAESGRRIQRDRSCLRPFGLKTPIWSRNSTRTTSHSAA